MRASDASTSPSGAMICRAVGRMRGYFHTCRSCAVSELIPGRLVRAASVLSCLWCVEVSSLRAGALDGTGKQNRWPLSGRRWPRFPYVGKRLFTSLVFQALVRRPVS